VGLGAALGLWIFIKPGRGITVAGERGRQGVSQGAGLSSQLGAWAVCLRGCAGQQHCCNNPVAVVIGLTRAATCRRPRTLNTHPPMNGIAHVAHHPSPVPIPVLSDARLRGRRGSWSAMLKTLATRANHGRINGIIDANYPQSVCDPESNVPNKDPCAICWEEMPTASVLPCKHKFHRDCRGFRFPSDSSYPPLPIHA